MLDLTLQILANKQRRRILTELFESRRGHGVCVPEEVADEETELEDLYTEICHAHLPLLEDAQLVTWNADTHTVERGAKFDDVCPLLDVLTTNTHKLPGEWV